MDARRKLNGSLVRFLTALLLGGIVGALLGLLYARSAGEMYTSTASVMLSVNEATDLSELSAGRTYLNDSMKTYSVLATSATAITEEVVSTSGVPRDVLSAHLTVAGQANTTVMDFVYTDPDPNIARATAQAVAESFVKILPDAQPPASREVPLVTARLISPAEAGELSPFASTSARVTVGALLGAALTAAVMSLASEPSRRVVRSLARRAATDDAGSASFI